MTHEHRGHYGIAMLHPAHQENIGSVVRAAGCFDADYVATIGTRYGGHATSCGHQRHVPIWAFTEVAVPKDTKLVAIDYDENATPLSEFNHPERAMYILGEEGPGFENHPKVLENADETVYIESDYCMNVAVAGNMVLRDRYMSDRQ